MIREVTPQGITFVHGVFFLVFYFFFTSPSICAGVMPRPNRKHMMDWIGCCNMGSCTINILAVST